MTIQIFRDRCMVIDEQLVANVRNVLTDPLRMDHRFRDIVRREDTLWAKEGLHSL